MTRVVVAGAAGRMGREVVAAVATCDDLELVAAVDRQDVGRDAGECAGIGVVGVRIEADLGAALTAAPAQVLVDFTVPTSAAANALEALRHGTRPVIGTTGITAAEQSAIASAADSQALGALLVPNFAIGAVLMMAFAEQAAKYLPDVEIIELHHDKKIDAPSGTAALTARRIAAARARSQAAPAAPASECRGGLVDGVPIHSVRLPGLVAHQEVIFGTTGQTLTLRHDSLDRRSFMPGVLMAIRRVGSLTGLHVGLECVLTL